MYGDLERQLTSIINGSFLDFAYYGMSSRQTT